jgi:hypothetical protein
MIEIRRTTKMGYLVEMNEDEYKAFLDLQAVMDGAGWGFESSQWAITRLGKDMEPALRAIRMFIFARMHANEIMNFGKHLASLIQEPPNG